MEEYKPNSRRSREAAVQEAPKEKRVEKVVSGSTKRKKKNGFVKMADAFFQNDIRTVVSYVVDEILIPAAKRTVVDSIINSANMMVYGEIRDRDSRRPTNASRVNYRSYYDDRREPVRTGSGYVRPRNSYAPDDIIFDNRGDCEEMLDRMDEMIQQGMIVSVADFLDMAGEVPSHIDYKYGWESLRGATPKRVAEGWIIMMPRTVPIN